MKKAKIKRLTADAFLIVIGSVLFSVSVNMFSVPNAIVQGGLTGISIMIKSVFDFIPVGTAIFVLNIPLLVLGFMKIGGRFIFKTLIAIVVSTAATDIGSLFIPPYTGDILLACIFCGVFSGLGIALIMLAGATTGGTEIISMLVRLKAPDIPIGRMILFVDLAVITVSFAVYRRAEAIMYALVALFVCVKMIDFILGGAGHNKMMLIITEHPKKVCSAVMNTINRGATVIPASGGYTGEKKSLIFCVARASEASAVNRKLSEIDENSFTVVGDVGEVLGNGFR